ncbi:MAG: SdrD B-like domain-containing protein [Nitrosomonadales bacterium]
MAATGYNFREQNIAGLSGTVYVDANNDGVYQGGETALAGVTITLSGTTTTATDICTIHTCTTVTDSNGNYTFASLPAGTYTLTETQPAAYGDGKESIGTPAGTVNNSSFGSTAATNQIANITLAASQGGIGYNFGEVTGTLSGKVYNDANSNGSFDTVEPGISGVTLTLAGTDALGNTVNQTAITDASGNYSFTGLLTANASGYTITETQPAGYNNGQDSKGLVNGVVCSACNIATINKIQGISFQPNNSYTSFNFGEVTPLGSIAGKIYIDANNNGVADAGETPLVGVTVTLSGYTFGANGVDNGGTGDDVSITPVSTTTDASGNYSFSGLAPGKYTVTEPTQPPSTVNGITTAGNAGGTASSTATTPSTVAGIPISGATATGYNFGEVTPLGSIAGKIYIDANNNGVADAGETPLVGVSVTLSGYTFGANGVDNGGTGDDVSITPVSTTTDASGNYSFNGLAPGKYTVTEPTQPPSTVNGITTAGNAGGTASSTATTPSTVAGIPISGTTATGYNFGEVTPLGSIAGKIYIDANNNGVADAGETPLVGVTVTLSGYTFGANGVDNGGTGDDVSITPVSTTTDASGNYSFSGLAPGKYTVTEPTQPPSTVNGITTAGNAGGTASSTATTPSTVAGIPISGTTATGYNFGEVTPLGSIAGKIYIDANNNGVADVGETPLVGVTVTLSGYTFGANGVDNGGTGDDVSITPVSTTTDASGNYSFSGLAPGKYTVTEPTQPPSTVNGITTAGNAGGTASSTATTPSTVAGIPISGTTATGYNFGEVTPLGSIAGKIYIDANNNGVADVGETPLVGVTVTLSGYTFGANGVDNGGTGDDVSITPVSTTTDASGNYSFSGLAPGKYTVTEPTQPPSTVNGITTAGNAGGTASSTATTPSTVAGIPISGTTATGYNFGEVTPLGSIAGKIYIDANNNGVADVGETPLVGVTVTLSGYTFGANGVDNGGTGDDVSITPVSTTTDASGNYSFSGLAPGKYTVTEPTQPPSTVNGITTAGNAGGTASSTATTPSTVAGIPISGTTATGYNFGEVTPLGSIAGKIYIDANNNGVADAGETPLVGVSVTLSGYTFGANGVDNGGTGDDVSITPVSTTTDASGNYSFNGLAPGKYTVTEPTQPPSTVNGITTAGNAGGTASSTATTPSTVAGIPISGTTATGYNFGEVTPLGSIAGKIYIDANNNGVADAGETPLVGVTVTLSGYTFGANGVDNGGTGDDVSITPVSTTTDASGNYSFSGLAPGKYTVTEPTQPPSTVNGITTAGNAGGTASSTATTPSTVAGIPISGTTATGYNFGEVTPLGSIAGKIYIDANNNGVADAGETPLVGVSVTLSGYTFGANGVDNGGTGDDVSITPVSTTTDASGNYSFSGLAPGKYTVTEPTQPPSTVNGITTAGNAGGTASSTATTPSTVAGIPISGTTATGYNFGEIQSDSISGSVYLDVNNNRIKDAGEAIAGALLTLTGTNDLGQVVLLTTTTNVAGTYSFTNLRPSNGNGYTVTETQPAGYGDYPNNTGTVVGTVGGTAILNTTSAIVLVSGATATGYDFRETGGNLSGKVYLDANNNGTPDTGEVGLAGVTITLSGVSTSTTVTDVNGNYAFSNLLAGTYTLTETQPAAYGDGKESAGTPPGTVNNSTFGSTAATNQIANIPLGAGQGGMGYNFGELTGSLGGTVYNDLNANGSPGFR